MDNRCYVFNGSWEDNYSTSVKIFTGKVQKRLALENFVVGWTTNQNKNRSLLAKTSSLSEHKAQRSPATSRSSAETSLSCRPFALCQEVVEGLSIIRAQCPSKEGLELFMGSLREFIRKQLNLNVVEVRKYSIFLNKLMDWRDYFEVNRWKFVRDYSQSRFVSELWNHKDQTNYLAHEVIFVSQSNHVQKKAYPVKKSKLGSLQKLFRQQLTRQCDRKEF